MDVDSVFLILIFIAFALTVYIFVLLLSILFVCVIDGICSMHGTNNGRR